MKINMNIIAVLMVAVIAVLYLQVSFFSPVIFGDEGFYASISRSIAEDGIIPKYHPTAQTDISHKKFLDKPAFMLQEAFAWLMAGELGLKVLFPLFSLLAALMTYVFLKKLENPLAGIAAALMLLATPSMVTYGVMGYTDTMLVLLTVCFIYFGYIALKNNNIIHSSLSGIFLGLAILTKISAPFLVVFLLLIWLLLLKGQNKKAFLIIMIVALLFIFPWFVRNMVLFGDVCYGPLLYGPGCLNDIDKPIEDLGIEFAGRTQEIGSEASLLRFGILNYTRFAYGWAIPFLFFFGLVFVILRKGELDMVTILLMLSTLPLFYFSTGRAEDTARYMLPLVIPVSIIGGIFVSNTYEWLKKYSIAIAAVFILIFLLTTWVYGQEKLNTMNNVKQFIPGFFEGCEWVDKNTPKDSIVFSTYTHHVGYACNRRTAGGIPDNPEIFLTYNDTSYNHLKEHGFDYIFIIEGLISVNEFSENYPVKFIQYVDSSQHFKLIYDNRNVYGQAGVRIYEVI